MARLLGIKQFMVPKFAAGLSAFGGLISDIRWEETGTLNTLHHDFEFTKVNKLLASLKKRGVAFLERAGIPPDRRRFEYAFQGRYLYQSWDIEVPFELEDGRLREEELPKLTRAFHDMHERIYTIKDEADIVEFTTWKVRAIGDTGGSGRRGRAIAQQKGEPRHKSERRVYLGRSVKRVLPVYEGEALGAGAVVRGPAIIELATTTFLLLVEQTAQTDEHGNFLVENGKGL
jgi:N-methylhydantoinase A